MIADIVGWIGASVVFCISIPQFLLVVRTKQTHGLSVITWVISAGTGMAWLGHGIKLWEHPQIWPNIWGYFVTWTMLYFLHRNGRFKSWVTVLPGVALGVVLILLDNLVSATAFGLTVLVPQGYGMIRQGIALMRAPKVTGVSVITWVFQFVNQAIWLTWAILAGDPGVGISAAVCCVCALYVLVWRIMRAAGVRPIQEWGKPKTTPESELAECSSGTNRESAE